MRRSRGEIPSIRRGEFEHSGDIESADAHLSIDVQIKLFLVEISLFSQCKRFFLFFFINYLSLGLCLLLYNSFVNKSLLCL